MEGNQKRRWERLRKLLRLLVGRRKRKRFTLPEDSTNTNTQSLEEDSGGIGKAALPPESARLATLSPSSDLLASLNKFRLSTAHPGRVWCHKWMSWSLTGRAEMESGQQPVPGQPQLLAKQTKPA